MSNVPMSTMSTTPTTGVTGQQRLVVSRRAWQAHQKKLPKKPRPKAEKLEDKPWPRNVQIAGYVAAGIFIPYTSVWLITSNPTLRDWCSPYLPLEKVRQHFGELEWDAQSFPDKELYPLQDGFFRFPNEISYADRQQQSRIDAAEKEKVTANIYLLGDSQVKEVKQVPASTRANTASLAALVGSNEAQKLAVDFEDTNAEMDDSIMKEGRATDPVDGSHGEFHQEFGKRALLQETHIFSSWYYFPSEERQQASQNPRYNDSEIHRMRLEYTIQELEKSLKDPACTRDRDEMQTDLSRAKKELSRLNWKIRLGL